MEQFISKGTEQTRDIARSFARRLRPGDVVGLVGELGAGKTCFVQGLADGLGCKLPAASPTFTLLNVYPGPVPLYHLDLYRIDSPGEALRAGLLEYFDGDGVSVVEWADRWPELLPPRAKRVKIHFGGGPDERVVEIEDEPL